MPSWCSSEILLLTPLDRGFCKHVLHGRVLCGITPCWHGGQTGGLFILFEALSAADHPGAAESNGQLRWACSGRIFSGCYIPRGPADTAPHTVCTEPASLSSSPYHGVTAWSTTGDRNRKTRINSYQLPWRISMQEKGQWGWKMRHKLPTEQRWCVLETGVALRSVSSPPHP